MNACRSSSSAPSVYTSSNWSTTTRSPPARAAARARRAWWEDRPGCSRRSWATVAASSLVTAASSAASALRGREPGVSSRTGQSRAPDAPTSPRSAAGTTPARSTDDLPEPEGPTTATGPSPVAQRRSSRASTTSVSSRRPKNHSLSSGWKLARPRYGASAAAVRGPGVRRSRPSACCHCAVVSSSATPQARRIAGSRWGWLTGGRCRPLKYPPSVLAGTPTASATCRTVSPARSRRSVSASANSCLVRMSAGAAAAAAWEESGGIGFGNRGCWT